jgi:hypothetical protein
VGELLVVFAREQPGVWNSPVVFKHFARWPPGEVRLTWVDEESRPKGLSPEEHAKAHLVAQREREIDLVLLVTHDDAGPDDRTFLALARGALHRAKVGQWGFRPHRVHRGALPRMNFKANPLGSVTVEELDVKGVKGRRARARVDLALDPLGSKVGKGNPLPPSDRCV